MEKLPLHNPLAVAVFTLLGVHVNVYGKAPPTGITVSEPLHALLHKGLSRSGTLNAIDARYLQSSGPWTNHQSQYDASPQ